MNKHNKQLFIWVIFTLLQQLSGTEHNDISIGPAFNNDEIALRLFVRYLDDHDDICSFAETNKAYHSYTLTLAPIRKKLLTKVINGEHLGSFCHKYGSIYCQAYQWKDLNELVLTHSTLKSGQFSGSNQHFGRFIARLPYKQVPFFNDEGKVCFYGYGIVSKCLSVEIFPEVIKDVITILQYQTSATESKRLRCLMAKKGDEIGSKQMYRRFDFCMEYPSLLKAILNSSQVTQGSNDQELIFWLDGVTVPDNYAEKAPMKDLSDNWVHNNFEHLPDIIKDFLSKK